MYELKWCGRLHYGTLSECNETARQWAREQGKKIVIFLQICNMETRAVKATVTPDGTFKSI